MAEQTQMRRRTGIEQLANFVVRLFAATLLTSLVGAVANFIYELLLRPDLYAAGHPLPRAGFAFILFSPFILAGLIVLGLPTAYLLRRLNAENGMVYAATGVLTGELWGLAILELGTPEGAIMSGLLGGACALFWWWLRHKS